MKNIAQALQLAIKNIRSRFFHTFLSVLGIIIGVGALVSILSLIDGFELVAKEQIDQSTGINTVVVSAPDTEVINDVRIKKEDVMKYDYKVIAEMMNEVGAVPRYIMNTTWTEKVEYNDKEIASAIDALAYFESDPVKIEKNNQSFIHGEPISIENNENENKVAVVNESFVQLSGVEASQVLNKQFQVGEDILTVQGVRKDDDGEGPKIQMPASLISQSEMQNKSPMFFVQANDIEDLRGLKEQMDEFIAAKYPDMKDDVKVEINEFRMEQLEQGFLLFRVIMGLIVGISVIVGGVGIMNVMLITLKERTPEIGVRKAIGAKRRDILTQFLAESIFISLIGSALGIILGIAFTSVVIPVANFFIEQKGGVESALRASYTLNTILAIGAIAVFIGILFGTYPAIRASKLHPVDAIRRV